MSEVLPVVIGTAGHVDHGKTTLLQELVGGAPHTDRLPEERARGLTIDIGYAELDLGGGRRVGVVDVPGHERFVRNMVAAASGIDLVLLVVAADDGVMPQTREHLEIADLMGATTGIAVLTKIDLVDEELAMFAEEDVRDLLRGTFLEDAPILRVSGKTGEGVEELREVIAGRIEKATSKPDRGVFRMPIQRAFILPGHGTVITGVPLTGRVKIGDALEVVPGGKACRVRAIQAYHQGVSEARAGHRTALKLSDVSQRDVRRGHVVAEPGFLEPASLLEARLRLLPGRSRPLGSNTSIRFHTGTAEVLGRVFLLSTRKLEAGGEALVQFRLDRPVVAAPGDRYVLRSPSPQVTLGGGRVIGASRRKISASRTRMVREILEREQCLDDLAKMIRFTVRSRGLVPTDLRALCRATMARPDEVGPVVEEMIEEGGLVRLSGKLLEAGQVARGRTRIVDFLDQSHRREPLRTATGRAWVRERLGVSDPVLALLLQGEPGVESVPGGRLRLTGFEPRLSEEQRKRLAMIEAAVRDSRFATPRESELTELVDGPVQETAKLLDILRDRGDVSLLGAGVLLHREALAEAKRVVADWIRENGPLALAELKELLGMSRKYSIPLLEHLDEIRFTVRMEKGRILA